MPAPDVTKITTKFEAEKAGAGGVLTNLTELNQGADLAGTNINETLLQRAQPMPATMILSKEKTNGNESFRATFNLSTTDPDVSPAIDNSQSWLLPIKNQISDGGLRAKDIRITNRGAGSYNNPSVFKVTGGGSDPGYPAYFKVTSSSGILDQPATGTSISMLSNKDDVTSVVEESGKNFHTSTSDLDDPIVVTLYSGGGDGAASFEILSEEGHEGGNSYLRYQTRPVVLAQGMSARGIRVYLTAYKPAGGQIYVYYKTKANEDSGSIDEKKWKLMSQTGPSEEWFSDEPTLEAGAFQEFQFDTEEITSYTTDYGESFNEFNSFAVKLVVFTDKSYNPPVIKDFKAIALY